MEHEHEGEHNPDYDHEAFLGKDEAKTFDQLTPDESKDRLGLDTAHFEQRARNDELTD